MNLGNERNWKLKEEVKDRTLSKTRFVRGYGPVVRHHVVVVVVLMVIPD